MKQMIVKIKGISPTIMKNGQTANPMNKYAKLMKEITCKRKKTDDDYVEMARIEYESSLYLDDQSRPCWPAVNIEACLLQAAKKIKLGTLFKSACIVENDATIDQPHGKNIDVLFEKAVISNLVKVGQVRVMRTRPMFTPWGLTFILLYNDELIDGRDLEQICDIAGQQIGLSDWRPRYGRFVVVK